MEIGRICTIDTYNEVDIPLRSQTETHFGISIIANYYSSNERNGKIIFSNTQTVKQSNNTYYLFKIT